MRQSTNYCHTFTLETDHLILTLARWWLDKRMKERTNERDRINERTRITEWSFVRFVRSFNRFGRLQWYLARHTCTNKQCIIWLLCIAVKFIAFWLARLPASLSACWFLFPFSHVCEPQNRNENFVVLAHTDEEWRRDKRADNKYTEINNAAHNKKPNVCNVFVISNRLLRLNSQE